MTFDGVKRSAQQQVNRALKDHARFDTLHFLVLIVALLTTLSKALYLAVKHVMLSCMQYVSCVKYLHPWLVL